MKLRNGSFLLCLIFCSNSFSQSKLIELSSERNADNSISIYSDNRVIGDYTLKLSFSNYTGYSCNLNISSNAALVNIQRGQHVEIAKFKPQQGASSYAMQYRYNYYPGRAMRSVRDTSFVYLLPATQGNNIRVLKVNSLEERLGQKPAEKSYSIGFIYSQGDTICAARAGTVFESSDEALRGEKITQSYSHDRNKIRIQHKDGTLGAYSILAPIQLLIADGDYVVPGQPIAVFNKESDKYHVLFSVTYLDEKKLLAADLYEMKPVSVYTSLSTVFTDNTSKPVALEPGKKYEVAHPKELVGVELSKKDKKKLGL